MTACAKCQPELAPGASLHLCAQCFKRWPKGVTITEYLNLETFPEALPRTRFDFIKRFAWYDDYD